MGLLATGGPGVRALGPLFSPHVEPAQVWAAMQRWPRDLGRGCLHGRTIAGTRGTVRKPRRYRGNSSLQGPTTSGDGLREERNVEPFRCRTHARVPCRLPGWCHCCGGNHHRSGSHYPWPCLADRSHGLRLPTSASCQEDAPQFGKAEDLRLRPVERKPVLVVSGSSGCLYTLGGLRDPSGVHRDIREARNRRAVLGDGAQTCGRPPPPSSMRPACPRARLPTSSDTPASRAPRTSTPAAGRPAAAQPKPCNGP